MTIGQLPGDIPVTGQDVFILALRRFGHTALAEKAEKRS